jgi:hypothetical protein
MDQDYLKDEVLEALRLVFGQEKPGPAGEGDSPLKSLITAKHDELEALNEVSSRFPFFNNFVDPSE